MLETAPELDGQAKVVGYIARPSLTEIDPIPRNRLRNTRAKSHRI